MARTDELQARTFQRKQDNIQRRQMTEESLKSANEENFKPLSHLAPNGNLDEQGAYGSRC